MLSGDIGGLSTAILRQELTEAIIMAKSRKDLCFAEIVEDGKNRACQPVLSKMCLVSTGRQPQESALCPGLESQPQTAIDSNVDSRNLNAVCFERWVDSKNAR